MHKSNRRAGTTKTVQETEAEAVSFAVCFGLGLDCGSSFSDYIDLYDGNADTSLPHLESSRKPPGGSSTPSLPPLLNSESEGQYSS